MTARHLVTDKSEHLCIMNTKILIHRNINFNKALEKLILFVRK